MVSSKDRNFVSFSIRLSMFRLFQCFSLHISLRSSLFWLHLGGIISQHCACNTHTHSWQKLLVRHPLCFEICDRVNDAGERGDLTISRIIYSHFSLPFSLGSITTIHRLYASLGQIWPFHLVYIHNTSLDTASITLPDRDSGSHIEAF